jgi:hypothetical protein
MESIIEQIDELNQSFAHIVEVETEADDKAKVK